MPPLPCPAAAKTDGDKSAERKRTLIRKLLVSARESEAGYIVRGLQGKLRVGLAQATVLTALAHAALAHEEAAAGRPPPSAERLAEADAVLKAVYSECPSLDLIVPALLEGGVLALPARCHFVPGVPVKPMLSKPTHGIAEVLDRFSDCEFTCEYKYDGERAQVHVLEDGSVRVFSRNSEDMSGRYPDILATFKRHLRPGVRSVVLDSEAVAFDRATRRILPFQRLSTRARKAVAVEDVTVNVRAAEAHRGRTRERAAGVWRLLTRCLRASAPAGVPVRVRLPVRGRQDAAARAARDAARGDAALLERGGGCARERAFCHRRELAFSVPGLARRCRRATVRQGDDVA